MSKNTTVRCPCCNILMIQRRNANGGGMFLGCDNFESTGCKVSYSVTEDKFYGVPFEVARASKNRGRVVSKREQAIAWSAARLNISHEEATAYVDSIGLMQALTAAGRS